MFQFFYIYYFGYQGEKVLLKNVNEVIKNTRSICPLYFKCIMFELKYMNIHIIQ